MLKQADIEYLKNQLASETCNPMPFIDRDEMKLQYDELYDNHLFYLLGLAHAAHCNLKIDAAALDKIIVTFY